MHTLGIENPRSAHLPGDLSLSLVVLGIQLGLLGGLLALDHLRHLCTGVLQASTRQALQLLSDLGILGSMTIR